MLTAGFSPEPLRGKGKLKESKNEPAAQPAPMGKQHRRRKLSAALRGEIEVGFPEGDDAFDAVVGLFGMIEVITGIKAHG